MRRALRYAVADGHNTKQHAAKDSNIATGIMRFEPPTRGDVIILLDLDLSLRFTLIPGCSPTLSGRWVLDLESGNMGAVEL